METSTLRKQMPADFVERLQDEARQNADHRSEQAAYQAVKQIHWLESHG